MERTSKIILVIICLLGISILSGLYLKLDIISLSAIISIILSFIAIFLAIDTISLTEEVRKLVKKVHKEQIIIKNLIVESKIKKDIDDIKQETEEVEEKSDLTIQERKFNINKVDTKKLEQDYLDVDYFLCEEINEWSNQKQYPSSVVFLKPRTEIIDFILDTKDGPIPIELKVYPKRIISNNLPYKLRDRMNHIMDLAEATSSILVILNPEITKRAKTIVKETNRKIIIIQDKDKEELRLKFRKYIETLEPSEI